MTDADDPLVARFHTPPGWPAPSQRWLVEHQGIEIPTGWTPWSDIVAAPPRWVFWTLDGPRAAQRASVGALRRTRRTVLIESAIAAVGLIVTLATIRLALDTGGYYFVFWGAIVFGTAAAVRAGYRLRVAQRAEFSALADEARQIRAARSRGGDPTNPAEYLEDFPETADAGEWSWQPAVVVTGGQTVEPGSRGPRILSGGRSFRRAVVGIAAVGIVGGIVAIAVPSPSSADGISYTEEDSSDVPCPAADSNGCWAWRISPGSDCATAVVRIGLSTTTDGATVQEDSVTLTGLRKGVPVTFTDTSDDNALGYAGIDSVRCAAG